MNSPASVTTVYHLQMLTPEALQPKAAPEGFEVTKVASPDMEINRSFYKSVGGDWDWTNRLKWSDEQWQQYVYRDALQTWIGKYAGEVIGYFELEFQVGNNVEIAYFGLLPAFIGKGLGGPLLTATIEQAWAIADTKRVWVHTCTKDHKNALENYRKRGFELFKTELE